MRDWRKIKNFLDTENKRAFILTYIYENVYTFFNAVISYSIEKNILNFSKGI